MDERVYTTKTVAEYLCLSDRHVRELCDKRQLRHFRAGLDGRSGPYRIPSSALEEYMRLRMVKAEPNGEGSEECGSSGIEANGAPTNEPKEDLNEQSWARKIVRLRPDG